MTPIDADAPTPQERPIDSQQALDRAYRAVDGMTSRVGHISLRQLLRETTDVLERHVIEAALEGSNGNRSSAAKMLGISRQSLYVKLRKHRLTTAEDEQTPLPDTTLPHA